MTTWQWQCKRQWRQRWTSKQQFEVQKVWSLLMTMMMLHSKKVSKARPVQKSFNNFWWQEVASSSIKNISWQWVAGLPFSSFFFHRCPLYQFFNTRPSTFNISLTWNTMLARIQKVQLVVDLIFLAIIMKRPAHQMPAVQWAMPTLPMLGHNDLLCSVHSKCTFLTFIGALFPEDRRVWCLIFILIMFLCMFFLQTYFNSMEQTMHPTADEKEDNCHNAWGFSKGSSNCQSCNKSTHSFTQKGFHELDQQHLC